MFNKRKAQDHDAGIYLPEAQRKKRNLRSYILLYLFLAIVYLILVAAVWFVLHAAFFRISKIDISGNNAVSSDSVKGVLLSQIIRGNFYRAILGVNHFWNWPDKLDKSGLTYLPEIKNLEIKKDYSNRAVYVAVEERKPFGLWCYAPKDSSVAQSEANNPGDGQGSDCWWFDDEGVIFRRGLGVEGNLITAIRDYSQNRSGLNAKILPDKFISQMFSILYVLKNSGLDIREIRLNDVSLEELEADVAQGPKIYFSLRFLAYNDLQVIEDLIAKSNFQNLQYLDFRVENRAYYK